jgi:hypothetical protein
MLLTEEEAKTKWCPFARVAGTGVAYASTPHAEAWPVTVNRGGQGERDEVCCIASACMAWRWADEYRSSSGGCGSSDFLQAAGYPKPYEQLGYCGIAGRPE